MAGESSYVAQQRLQVLVFRRLHDVLHEAAEKTQIAKDFRMGEAQHTRLYRAHRKPCQRAIFASRERPKAAFDEGHRVAQQLLGEQVEAHGSSFCAAPGRTMPSFMTTIIARAFFSAMRLSSRKFTLP